MRLGPALLSLGVLPITKPEKPRNKPLIAAISFGVIAATVEMAMLLRFMYC